MTRDTLTLRRYGAAGPVVILVHGGPGAPGSMAPVARGLADAFRILEPFQRGSGAEPLTVAQHVEDLRALVDSCGEPRPAMVGHSWGAMLALAFAAAYPGRLSSLALVGCGTFDLAARAQMKAILDRRMDAALRARLADLDEAIPDPDARLKAKGELIESVYDIDPIQDGDPIDDDPEPDARAHDETWADMLRLQAAGIYPAVFSAIDVPVLMLHGADDPHPGQMIYASLAQHVRSLDYVEWAGCGHSPWKERAAREEFFAALKAWLMGHA